MALRIGPPMSNDIYADYVNIWDDDYHAAVVFGYTAASAERRARQFLAAADLLPELAEWFTEFRDELIADHYGDDAIDSIIEQLTPFAHI